MNHAEGLQEPTFYILLSLAAGEKHGYAILKDVHRLSAGRMSLGTGTLYGALARLLDQGWIAQTAGPTSQPARPGRPRRAYTLTHRGRRVLDAETARLESMAAAARQQFNKTAEGACP